MWNVAKEYNPTANGKIHPQWKKVGWRMLSEVTLEMSNSENESARLKEKETAQKHCTLVDKAASHGNIGS